MKTLLLSSAVALVLFLAPGQLIAEHHESAEAANPCAAKTENRCNPCVGKANPCTAKVENPCNPCAAKVENPCNPCAAKNPCTPDE